MDKREQDVAFEASIACKECRKAVEEAMALGILRDYAAAEHYCSVVAVALTLWRSERKERSEQT